VATSFGATYTSLVPVHAASPVLWGGFADEIPANLRTPGEGHDIFVIAITREPRGQIPASVLERVIQERLCRAILGLNVRHDLDIDPATSSVSSLPGKV
jgi:hypothetical protein